MQDLSKTLEFEVWYSSTASNFLISMIIMLYLPIAAPLFLIPLDMIIAGVMMVLLVPLGLGIYNFRARIRRKAGTLLIAPGDLILHGEGIECFVIRPKGLRTIDGRTLRFTTSVLFENMIYFRDEADCSQAVFSIHTFGY